MTEDKKIVKEALINTFDMADQERELNKWKLKNGMNLLLGIYQVAQ